MDSCFSCVTIFCVEGRLLGCWCRTSLSHLPLQAWSHLRQGNGSTPSFQPRTSYCSSWPLLTPTHIFLLHHLYLCVLAYSCSFMLYVSLVPCVFVRFSACVVATIDRLMPKRKFPEFCEGLLQKAGIKTVCLCVWRTVLVSEVGEGWLHFGEKKE